MNNKFCMYNIKNQFEKFLLLVTKKHVLIFKFLFGLKPPNNI